MKSRAGSPSSQIGREREKEREGSNFSGQQRKIEGKTKERERWEGSMDFLFVKLLRKLDEN